MPGPAGGQDPWAFRSAPGGVTVPLPSRPHLNGGSAAAGGGPDAIWCRMAAVRPRGSRCGWGCTRIGEGARPQIIRAAALAAEAHGFPTLWAGEHVVLVDSPASRYPYSADGRIVVPPGADWRPPPAAPWAVRLTSHEIRIPSLLTILAPARAG